MSSKSKLHARRRAARFGDLDLLLAEALRDQRRGEGAVKRLKGINSIIHEQFANPENWTQRGVVMIIYVDEHTGEQQTVGLFQELVHKTSARKLVRVASDMAQNCTFSVAEDRDPFLIRGKPVYTYVPPAAKDPLAQLAIRDYLARTKAAALAETLGLTQIDADGLLNQLKAMGVEKLR